ncbi:vegetative cell wall protein gp1-like [Zingiber officinale]|uniref:vegetative cell wall protein gp1-like n=1 Tax=Zingiber officinale TaxID=94328 RepID=UPI001C4CBD87|nr:vegetative cell wall protein gp1-like [Zingiber officinale]
MKNADPLPPSTSRDAARTPLPPHPRAPLPLVKPQSPLLSSLSVPAAPLPDLFPSEPTPSTPNLSSLASPPTALARHRSPATHAPNLLPSPSCAPETGVDLFPVLARQHHSKPTILLMRAPAVEPRQPTPLPHMEDVD